MGQNRSSVNRRKIKRSGWSIDRRGSQSPRSGPNPEKAKKIAKARRIWKANKKEGGTIR